VPKFQEVFAEVLPRFRRFDVGAPKMELRRMKNRWGSCTASGTILLNPELIKAPKRCIEYVATHELCHLIIPEHNKKFFALLSEMMPGWERWKLSLEKSGSL
jgi:predicted metal-dependent hydrolase